MKLCLLPMLCSASVATAPLAHAEDKQNNEELSFVSGPPEQCLRLNRIDRTDILDDQNILFYMRGDEIYRNHLPHRCPGLSHYDTIMYRTSLSQLCNLDIVTVLDSMAFGFIPGVSCGLGLFYPVTQDDAAGLKAQLEEENEVEEP